MFYVFIPITQASAGKFTFNYFMTLKTLAFLLSCCAILAHFFLVRFALIESDSKYIVILLSIWIVFNLVFENQEGVYFAELKGSRNTIKISLSVFIIGVITVMYLVMCPFS
jgi:hypothetical protein